MPLTVDILTPEKIVLQTQSDFVVVPALEGELGILPRHAPLMAQLQAGVIRMRLRNEMSFFSVSGGFIQMLQNAVAILAESVELAQEIDVERARQAAERARQALSSSPSRMEALQAEAALRRAIARMRTYDALRRLPRSGSFNKINT